MRFVPDSWLDWLLRPFYMIDAVAGLYLEIAAPDFRFAIIVLLLLVGVLTWRKTAAMSVSQRCAVAGLLACFAVWTKISGNGRYFIWALLMAGPVLVVLARRLNATVSMRNTVIVVALALQAFLIHLHLRANLWEIRPWTEGPGLALEPNSMKDRPAAFLTFGAISYSALVPQMHPESRWANVSGQFENVEGAREYPALVNLLRSDLPKYVVFHAIPLTMAPDLQPSAKVWQSITGLVSRYGLTLVRQKCTYVRSRDAAVALARTGAEEYEEGFWFCPVNWNGPSGPLKPVSPEYDAIFEQIENRCPLIFPPKSVRSRQIGGAVQRGYSGSDTSVYVDESGEVYFKNMRALNPTILGTKEQVRNGQFKLDCERIPGRYLPPWARP